MGMLIKTNGTMEEIMPTDGNIFKLDELQKLVGGYIELVSIPPKLMIVNEEAKIKPGFSINKIATQLTRGRIAEDDYILGDVLVCTPSEMGK